MTWASAPLSSFVITDQISGDFHQDEGFSLSPDLEDAMIFERDEAWAEVERMMFIFNRDRLLPRDKALVPLPDRLDLVARRLLFSLAAEEHPDNAKP